MGWTLVTGGTSSLGEKICLELASKGMPILVHFRNSEAKARDVVAACRKFGVKGEAVQGDFSTLEATLRFADECVKRFYPVKNLINNVGNYLIKSAAKTTPQEWNDLFQTNLHAPFALCEALLPGLIETQGNIVNIGVAGINNIRADVNRTAYATAKMSLWMLTKSLAREVASKDVRVNMVSPGYLESAVDLPTDRTKIPMGMPASFGDVTRVISFLLNEESHYITGQNIEVSGGIGL